jgi:hypothetical protein
LGNHEKTVLSVFASLDLLAGCFGSNSGGKEFDGKWVNVKSEKTTLEVVRNDGNNFILRETTPNFFGEKLKRLVFLPL